LHSFYNSKENVFLGAATGSGKTAMAQLAIYKALSMWEKGISVYVCPMESIAKQIHRNMVAFFEPLGFQVGILTGQAQKDLKIMKAARLVISNCSYWDMFSRRWKKRKLFKNIRLFIADELHLLGASGSVLEVVISRMRYISSQLETPFRIIGLSSPVANYMDIAEWIGAPVQHTFNFHPNIRPN